MLVASSQVASWSQDFHLMTRMIYLYFGLLIYPLSKHSRTSMLLVYTEGAGGTPDTHLAANACALILQNWNVFIRSTIHSFIQPFIHSIIRSVARSVIQLLFRAFIRLLTHSYTHSFVQLAIIQSFIYLFVHKKCVVLCRLGKYSKTTDVYPRYGSCLLTTLQQEEQETYHKDSSSLSRVCILAHSMAH